MVNQVGEGYFMPRSEGIAFILHLYLHCVIVKIFSPQFYDIKYSYRMQIVST